MTDHLTPRAGNDRLGSGVEPATDEQIEAWDGWPLTTHRSSMVIARVRQEQARADSEERARHQIEDERDEAVARAEKAEAEVARMRPVLAAWSSVEHANAYGTRDEWIDALGSMSEAVDAARAARKEGDRG